MKKNIANFSLKKALFVILYAAFLFSFIWMLKTLVYLKIPSLVNQLSTTTDYHAAITDPEGLERVNESLRSFFVLLLVITFIFTVIILFIGNSSYPLITGTRSFFKDNERALGLILLTQFLGSNIRSFIVPNEMKYISMTVMLVFLTGSVLLVKLPQHKVAKVFATLFISALISVPVTLLLMGF